jgi:hypothetical protein
MAARMDGVVTDEAGQVLTPMAWEQIQAGLDARYEALQRRELPAGSALARRLFS